MLFYSVECLVFGISLYDLIDWYILFMYPLIWNSEVFSDC